MEMTLPDYLGPLRWSARCSGVVASLSSSIKGCSTMSVRATFANDCT